MMTKLLGPKRASACLTGLVALAGACAPKNLPDDQLLTSAHFRYHARATAALDPTVVDRLEALRSEFDTRFGIDSPIVDYYLFDDDSDLLATSPCADRPCTIGSSIFAISPFHEHELVHGLLSDAGQPSLIVSEGVAQHEACIQTQAAAPISPAAWPGVVGSGNESDDVYDFGQRLTGWMLAAGGPADFIAFYGKSLPTRDPALFALQFQAFWGRRLGDVAAELDDDRYEGSSCPCGAPAVPDDGSPASFVARQDYRTLDVSVESRLELASSGPLLRPASCANARDHFAQVFPSAPVASTVARVGAGRFGVVAWPGADPTSVTVRQTRRPQSDWSCEAALAAPVVVGSEDVALWVTADAASDPNGTWFAVNNVDGPRVLSMLSGEGMAFVCTSCDGCGGGGGAVFSGPFPVAGGVAVIHLLGGLDDASVGVLLSHPAS